MNLNLPRLENENYTLDKFPFEGEYVSYVLRNYLIDGKSIINIDNEYFGDNYADTGKLCSVVLDYYGLISSDSSFDNKGIYSGQKLDDVVEFLDKQSDVRYKKIASGLANIEFFNNYSEEELGRILGERYNNAAEKTKIASLYLFGIEFAKLIEKNNYDYKKIYEYSNIPASNLDVELSKALRISKFVKLNDVPKVVEYVNKTNRNLKEIDNTGRVKGGNNYIYYGAPGCGKSFKIRKRCKDENFEMIRTTFYPDYTNGEFVGQIVPKIDDDGRINYVIKPGYFTSILFEAMLNPTKKYALVIEEINRGNASAIFGDIFQLLDRDDDGNSEFDITNDLITEYFSKNGYILNKIIIPSNLSIMATMNTSDQNVYILDTAFKRRWKLEKISNEFDNSDYDTKLKSMLIPGSNSVTWKDFIDKINSKIFEKNSYGVNAEDKQIGKYFVGLNDLVEKSKIEDVDVVSTAKKSFAEKVLMYLWEDVTKLNHEAWFNPKYRTLDNLLLAFKTENLKVFNGIFDESVEDDNNE